MRAIPPNESEKGALTGLHPCAAGAFAPLHPRRGTQPGSCDLAQPCAGWIRDQAFAPDTTTRERGPAPYDPSQPSADWMRGNGLPRCIDIRGLSPKPRVSGFARRHPRA
jgi:hypothetical protein